MHFNGSLKKQLVAGHGLVSGGVGSERAQHFSSPGDEDIAAGDEKDCTALMNRIA